MDNNQMNPESLMGQAGKFGLKRVLSIFLIILSIFVAVKTVSALTNFGSNRQEYPPQNIISVAGKGEVLAIPDLATFSFAVTEEASTVAEAQKEATLKVNVAIKFLKEKGVADKDIKTTYYNIYPRYVYPQYPAYSSESDRKLVAYEVGQGIEVKVRKIELAGELLSGVGGLGVQNISSLNFSVDREADLKKEARNKAIVEAKSEAKKLARSLGVRLVRIISFNENDNYPPIYLKYGVESVASGRGGDIPNPELPAGESKIVSNVTITYEIR